MKDLIFSHFLEIFLINLVEIKLKQPIHFGASGSVAGIMVSMYRYPYGPLSRCKHLCFGGKNQVDPGSFPGCGRNGPCLCPLSSSSSVAPSPVILRHHRHRRTCANGHEYNHVVVFWKTFFMA